MATVKPYIVTIKYIAVYSDPAPTVEQIANELNIDATEITIEEAVVIAKPSAPTVSVFIPVAAAAEKVVEELLDEDTDEPVISAPAVKIYEKKNAPFDVANLERGGTSMKVLSVLYKAGNEGRTLSEIRELTNINGPSVQVTVSRLKSQGRIKVVKHDVKGRSVYRFVK